ncbi:NAD-dependent epimerase/dehydratase family protein [Amorphus orientalis]|uniref:UDP-glucuronate decarboxylase n=1 Tax=Amorphus orientalis TaxID=649198 RepID=A0AAE3VQB5_9HYPH|nr:GDP-mannose 4,6-dehydratase [Amorphus orientalis]MDQ0316201.1 UDP-glucose 4-epimerase [Amorphus orientalis]
MKILITGAAGFIGSNLTNALLREGHEVVGFDDMSHGDMLNLEEAKKSNNKFSLVLGTIMDQDALEKACEGCDLIYHLAARKIPRYSDAYDTLTVNGMGSHNVAIAARKVGAKLVAASTSDVYGKNPDLPFTETSNLVVGNPDVRRWAYAISKMFEEQLIFAMGERDNLPFSIARFFGGYGPAQHLSWWGGPQSVFIDAALDDKEIELHGSGQQTRSFTFVSDHVSGLILMGMKDEANAQVFNLGNTYEITIENLARLIWRLVRGEDSEPKLKLIPYETFGKYEDVNRRVPSVDKAGELLGYKPEVALPDGMVKTIQWQVARRRALGIETRDPAC